MPYISQESRKKLDPDIERLADAVSEEAKRGGNEKEAFAGVLNYSITRLVVLVVKNLFGRIRYWVIASVTGMLSNISSEFYRRVASPYEDKKIKEEGDVDLYEKLDA